MGSESRATTVVLLGRTGNGKSATGNSLLGRNAFKSRQSSKGVTDTCKIEQTVLNDGRILNVVDTPGIFDTNHRPEYLAKEIVKCMNFAKEGLHGVLLVLSVKNRFTPEEAAAMENLEQLFGEKFVKYMVVVFTGGDGFENEENEDEKQTFEEYLRDSPPELQRLLEACNHRIVLFNNKTKSKIEKEKQLIELLNLIDNVMDENEGHPYSNEMFREAQMRAKIMKDLEMRIESSNEKKEKDIESLKRELEKQREEQREFLKNVEDKARLSAEKLQLQLAVETQKREAAELKSKLAKAKLDEEIRSLQGKLENANKEIAKKKDKDGWCHIM